MQELRRKININGEDFLLAVSQHGEGPPVIGTLGKPGVLYLDTEASPERLYICTAANVEAGVYTWRPIEDLLKITVSGDTTVVPGEDGITPHIGENGNWYLGDTDTGVRAAGAAGENGGYYSPEITPNEADNSFTITFKASKSGMPAVAPATIKLPEKSNDSGENGDGLSDTAKTLLITILRNVGVYTTDQSANITALENALASGGGSGDSGGGDSGETEKTLTSISAVYSGGSVAVGTAVSALTGIVVTAHYSDGSTATVTGYTLSGSIAEGSNTITVSYGGKTTTFTVAGVAESGGETADNPFDSAAWDTGKYFWKINDDGTVEVQDNDAFSYTDLVDVSGYSNVVFEDTAGTALIQAGVIFYDASENGISMGYGYLRKDNADYPSPKAYAIPENTKYARLNIKTTYLSALKIYAT